MGFKVNFTKTECLVINDEQVVIMRGVRSKDNCYMWESKNTTLSSVCSTDKDEEEVKLWQQESDHPHFRGMKRISFIKGVRRIPRFLMDKGRICGKYKAGQEIRMSHSMSRQMTTPKVLKQSTRIWHERITKYLTVKGYRRRVLEETLFVKGGKIMVLQIYVNNIAFGRIPDTIVRHVDNQMQAESGMNLIGELIHFLGLQVSQMEDSTLLSQNKYARNYVKKLGMKNGSHTRTLTPPHLKWSKKTSGERVDQSLCKSPCDGCFFLRKNLISWISKKQNCLALYNVEDEYIAEGRNCFKMIWTKQMLTKYNVTQDVMTLSCDIFTEVLEASKFKTFRDKLGICQYEEL